MLDPSKRLSPSQARMHPYLLTLSPALALAVALTLTEP